MASVARAPQDPHLPTKCLCHDRKEGKLARWVTGLHLWETGKGRKKHPGGGNTLVTPQLSWKILLLETSALNLCPPPLDFPTHSILLWQSRKYWYHTQVTPVCPYGTLAEKEPR